MKRPKIKSRQSEDKDGSQGTKKKSRDMSKGTNSGPRKSQGRREKSRAKERIRGRKVKVKRDDKEEMESG
jgi:hypothetical protein